MKTNRRVVLLSRSPAVGCLVSSVLERDCSVVPAFSLAQARRLVPENMPDVLLYDMDMSRHCWVRTMSELKSLDLFAPLVLITNKLTPDVMALASSAYIDGFLCKPLRIADIEDTVFKLSRRVPVHMNARDLPKDFAMVA
jgi:DNA-binding NtrC family response regulator